MPKLGIVVYVDPRHAEATGGLLDALRAQRLDQEQFSITIADNVHVPIIRAAVDRFREGGKGPRLTHLAIDPPGRAAALNAALRTLDCDLVWIVADDARPGPYAARAMIDYHRHDTQPLAAGVGAMIFSDTLRRDAFRCWAEDSGELFGVPLSRPHPAWPGEFFYAGNACLKRVAFERVGYFDERIPGFAGDDYEFGLRWRAAGGGSQLIAGARAGHEHWVTLEERLGNLREAGHAARIHETQIGIARPPWWPILDRARRARDLPEPMDDASLPLHQRVPIFKALLDAAFLEGYEATSTPASHGVTNANQAPNASRASAVPSLGIRSQREFQEGPLPTPQTPARPGKASPTVAGSS